MYGQLVLPEYALHLFFNLLFLAAGEWFSLLVNLPLILYHIQRYSCEKFGVLIMHCIELCSDFSFIFHTQGSLIQIIITGVTLNLGNKAM